MLWSLKLSLHILLWSLLLCLAQFCYEMSTCQELLMDKKKSRFAWCFIVNQVTNAISCSNKLKHYLKYSSAPKEMTWFSYRNIHLELPILLLRNPWLHCYQLLPTVLHLNLPWRHSVFNSLCFHSTQPLLATQSVWAELWKGERKREREAMSRSEWWRVATVQWTC